MGRAIRFARSLDAREAEHHLHFVEFARGRAHLIDDEHVLRMRLVTEERVDLVAVSAFTAPNVAVVTRHATRPRAIFRHANAAGRILDADLQAVQANVTLLVHARGGLRSGGLGRVVLQGGGRLVRRGRDALVERAKLIT